MKTLFNRIGSGILCGAILALVIFMVKLNVVSQIEGMISREDVVEFVGQTLMHLQLNEEVIYAKENINATPYPEINFDPPKQAESAVLGRNPEKRDSGTSLEFKTNQTVRETVTIPDSMQASGISCKSPCQNNDSEVESICSTKSDATFAMSKSKNIFPYAAGGILFMIIILFGFFDFRKATDSLPS